MSKRILVIDDEPDVLEIVRAVLNTKGHDVVTAVGGEAGLTQARATSPDLIICDLMMPRISGLEVLKRLKADEKLRKIPTMVLSALGDDDERTPEFWARTLGVDDYIHKPFDPLDLLGRVEYLFRRGHYVSSGNGGSLGSESATRANRSPSPDSETHVPVDVRSAPPEEVIRAFVESWNCQDFATEYHCLSSEMVGQMDLHDYVGRRRQTYMEEKGQGRLQKLLQVLDKKVSVNVASVSIERRDTMNNRERVRRETYTLKKTHNGWKILTCRAAR